MAYQFINTPCTIFHAIAGHIFHKFLNSIYFSDLQKSNSKRKQVK